MLKKILSLLTRRERKQALGLFVLIALSALSEVVGIVSVVPFLAILANPSLLDRAGRLHDVYVSLHFGSARDFLLAIGAVILIVLVLTNVLRITTAWSLARFNYMRGHALAIRLLTTYMNRPYNFFLLRNSSDMAENILSEVTQVLKNILITTMQIVARSMVCLAILAMLLFVDPVLTLSVFAILGGAYSLIYLAVHKKMHEIGVRRKRAVSERFRLLAEIFAGIKDMKIMHKEQRFLQRFETPSRAVADAFSQYEMIGIVPRSIFDVVAFGGILLVALFLMSRGENMEKIIPTIGLYALAGQRLLPALQNIFVNAAQIRFGLPSLQSVLADLEEGNQDQAALTPPAARLPFQRDIVLRNLSFSYEQSPRTVLERLELAIPANATVGFVGGTGAGKSTLIDIVTGLLPPTSGELLIDGTPIDPGNVRAWQENIGYVGQNIVLFDDTVARNIALGLDDGEIDLAAVERAARAAQLHDFITGQLPDGYGTLVGENGVRLSGGQRQRLGLARALYRDPSVLILDEATSALDNLTERSVMEAIATLSGRKTILMIAHRLTTVKDCDVIYLLDQGRITASGTFDGLRRDSDEFRKLAQAV